MKPRVLKVITGVNMGMEHSGLHTVLMKQAKLDLYTLGDDELVLCINNSGTACKLIGSGGAVIGYLRMPFGGKLKISSLGYISDAFGGSGFQYGTEVRQILAKLLEDESGNLKQA